MLTLSAQEPHNALGGFTINTTLGNAALSSTIQVFQYTESYLGTDYRH